MKAFRLLLVPAAALAVMAADGEAGGARAAPSGPGVDQAPAMARTELEKLKPLQALAQAGQDEKLLDHIRATDLKDTTYRFKCEVMTLQAGAFRRTKQVYAAMTTMRLLTRHAAKLPEYCRKKEVDRLVLPTQVLMLARTGKYTSSRFRRGSGEAPPEPLEIADDANWEKAKEDYAQHLLERTERDLEKRLPRTTTPSRVESKLYEALKVPDLVRPHFPGLANSAAASIAGRVAARVGQIVDNHPSVARARKLIDRTLLREYGALNLKVWRRIVRGIIADVRTLYVLNYNCGKYVTQYGRERNILDELDGPLGRFKDRNEQLKQLFVDVDNTAHYKALFKGHTQKTLKNDPLAKIPTDPW